MRSFSVIPLALAIGALTAIPGVAVDTRAADAGALGPSAIFSNKCSTCHTFGKGERIGPDLKGVTTRRTKPWLMAWIRSSEQLIKTGDRIATELFTTYQRQRMPDHDLSEAEIVALIDYLDRSGPEADERRALRQASTATSGEVDLGRKLFYGAVPFASGSLACASCHSLAGELTGATFGPSLGSAFTRYQDRALDTRLEVPCLHVSPARTSSRVIAPESLAIRAFLRSVALQNTRAKAAAVTAAEPSGVVPAKAGGPRDPVRR